MSVSHWSLGKTQFQSNIQNEASHLKNNTQDPLCEFRGMVSVGCAFLIALSPLHNECPCQGAKGPQDTTPHLPEYKSKKI